MKRTANILLLLAILSFAGCREEKIVVQSENEDDGKSISFAVANWEDFERLTRADIDDVKTNGLSIYAAREDGSVPINNAQMTYASPYWNYGTKKYWVDGHTYHFFASYPYYSSSSPFTYTYDNVQMNYTEASRQEDYMWDAKTRSSSDNYDNYSAVQFDLKHILAQVKFQLKNDHSGAITVTGASLTGQINTATLTLPASGNATKTSTSATSGNDYTTTPAACVASGEASISGNNIVIQPDHTATVLVKYVLPQTFNKSGDPDPTFTLNYTEGTSKSKELKIHSKAGTNEWIAGQVYTYLLSIAGDIGVIVTDVNGTIYVQNTGNFKEFVRVALIGNWYDSAGNIVADGSNFTCTINTTDWTTKQSDGFYYSNEAIEASEAPGTVLLSGIQKPTGATPANASYWQLTILVQGIINDADGQTAQSAFSN